MEANDCVRVCKRVVVVFFFIFDKLKFRSSSSDACSPYTDTHVITIFSIFVLVSVLVAVALFLFCYSTLLDIPLN